MFGIGLPEMILILALALIVVGPDKLPDLARSVAKGVLELKKTVSGLKDDLEKDNPFDSVKPELEEVSRSIEEKLSSPDIDEWKGVLPTEGVNQAPESDRESEIIEAETVDTVDTEEPTDSPDDQDAISDASQFSNPDTAEHVPEQEEQDSKAADSGNDHSPTSSS